MRKQKIINILRNRGDAEIIFSTAFHQSINKFRRILMLHEPPRFINDQNSAFHLRTHHIPNIIDDIVNRHCSKFILKITHAESDQLIRHINVGRSIEQTGKRSSRKFFQSQSQISATLHTIEHIIQILHNGRLHF